MFIEKWCNIVDNTVNFKYSFEKYLFNKIVTCDRKMLEQLKLIEKVAKSDVSVIICGETGCGKELFAEYIHDKSSRSKNNYVKINCATITESLFESEMFGYEPGSFTGALKAGKKGIFEIANSGTLFLDEIAEMPRNMQSKFLRVLQENNFTKIGGTVELNTDVRIVAATNRSLSEMVEKDEFREDLYYRLNIISINIPPIRERQEDIILLSLYFLDKYNNKYLVDKKMSKKVMQNFISYEWPGNVRELKHTMERLVLLTNNDIIDEIDIMGNNIKVKRDKNYKNITYNNYINMNDLYELEISENKSLKDIVSDFEMRVIKDHIKKYGSLRKTAKILKISPSSISRKLALYKNKI